MSVIISLLRCPFFSNVVGLGIGLVGEGGGLLRLLITLASVGCGSGCCDATAKGELGEV